MGYKHVWQILIFLHNYCGEAQQLLVTQNLYNLRQMLSYLAYVVVAQKTRVVCNHSGYIQLYRWGLHNFPPEVKNLCLAGG